MAKRRWTRRDEEAEGRRWRKIENQAWEDRTLPPMADDAVYDNPDSVKDAVAQLMRHSLNEEIGVGDVITESRARHFVQEARKRLARDVQRGRTDICPRGWKDVWVKSRGVQCKRGKERTSLTRAWGESK